MALSKGVKNLINTVSQDTQTQEELRGYLQDMLHAFGKVDSDYYISDPEYADSEKAQRLYERCFAYELYHQLRQIMGHESRKADYTKVKLNGETGKNSKTYKRLFLESPIALDNIQLEDFINKCLKKYKKFSPDLILHQASGFDHQVYMAEIKMDTNNDALSDLKKLTDLRKNLRDLSNHTGENAGFYFYLFIYTGNLETKIEHVQNDTWNRISDITKTDHNIICLYRIKHQDNPKPVYKCMTLGEVVGIVKKKKQ